MMSCVWRFLRRHRRKCFLLVAVSVGAAAAWHLLLPRVRRLHPGDGSSLALEFLHQARHHQHQEGTLRNGAATAASLLPRLGARLASHVDTESLLAELRTAASGASRVALWQELKVRVVTRTLVSLYAASLVAELVHVQLSVLGGYLFLHTARRHQDCVELADGVKMAYLGAWRHVLDADVAQLVARVGAIAQRIVGPVALQEAVSLRRLDTLLHEVRLAFDSELDACVRVRVCCDGQELGIADQAVLARLVRETQELVDCPDFMGVYKACLDSAFSSLLDHLAEEYHRAGSGDAYMSIYDVRIPFAKVVPLVDKVANCLLTADVNSQFNRDLLATDVLRAFSRNVYDTFSGKV